MRGDDLLQAGDNKNICTECKTHYLTSTAHPTRAFPGTASKYRYCPLTYPDYNDWLTRILPQKHTHRVSLKKRPPDFALLAMAPKMMDNIFPQLKAPSISFAPRTRRTFLSMTGNELGAPASPRWRQVIGKLHRERSLLILSVHCFKNLLLLCVVYKWYLSFHHSSGFNILGTNSNARTTKIRTNELFHKL